MFCICLFHDAHHDSPLLLFRCKLTGYVIKTIYDFFISMRWEWMLKWASSLPNDCEILLAFPSIN